MRYLSITLFMLIALCGCSGGSGGSRTTKAPTPTPTPTPAPTGQCYDGTYTYQTNCDNPCPNNGGILQWYNDCARPGGGSVGGTVQGGTIGDVGMGQ